jgi:hypothetical protein
MLSSSKIRPAGAELFLADWQTDRRDEAYSRFPQFREHAQNCFVFDCLYLYFSICHNTNKII